MKQQEYLEYVQKHSRLVKDLGNCTDGREGNTLELRISNHIPSELFILWIPPNEEQCHLFVQPKISGCGHLAASNLFRDAIAEKPTELRFSTLAEGVKTRELHISYIPDSSRDFAFELDRAADEGILLDHIMRLPDGDIGNYKIFERII